MKNDICCEVAQIHEDVLARLGHRMPDERRLEDVAELFKMFGDKTRAKILCALNMEELCVCDLAAVVGMSVSAVSHQLRLLKSAELVRSRREGKSAIYSLADDHVRVMISNGMEHILE